MSSFDPMATAIDWLDVYRAAPLAIVELHADDRAVECGCERIIAGSSASGNIGESVSDGLLGN